MVTKGVLISLKILAIPMAVFLAGCNNPVSPDTSLSGLPGKANPNISGTIQYSGSQAVIVWPDMPVVVYGGSEDWVLRRSQTYDLGAERSITALSTFMGWDRGDIGEAHVIVSDERGVVIYARSMHRQNGYDENYDAMNTASPIVPTKTRTISVDLLVRCTGDNLNPGVYPRDNTTSVFFEANLRVYY